jgi:hypothetical protein
MRELYNFASSEFKEDHLYKEGLKAYVPALLPAEWDVHFLSDSIVITGTYGRKPDQSVFNQLANHQIVVYLKALDLGFLLRGAISFGDFYQDKEIVIGPAIDDAARWADLAEWAGVVLTPSAADLAITVFHPSEIDAALEFARWEVPLKTGGSLHTFALWWPRQHQRSRLIELFDAAPNSVDVALKRQNTLEFHDEMNRRMFSKVPPPAGAPHDGTG